MFTAEKRVGRLCEARIIRLSEVSDVAAYAAAIQGLLSGPVRQVLCADYRPVQIYRPQVADALTALYRTVNQRLERVAIVVAPTNATLSMQIQRIARESAHPSRSVFSDSAGVRGFLDPVLTPAERERLAAFLGEPASAEPKPR
jgi:hypothetical protein